ncbi:GntR family transcriptional regulator [Asticcacaulis sp.]|uniref:GntR family transcriptional regulator n=1 Tax=Asticcacaulis sp. TaxID=1872648 RepID=UPI002603434A|nr:GntR family transcriptional regulator [Asticcacaulis sp.]
MNESALRSAFLKDDGGHAYLLIRNAIRDEITGGKLKPGAALAPERELCVLYGVSRITVRKAVEGLVEEGLLTRTRGSGTYVSMPSITRVEKNFAILTSFSEDIRSRGYKPSSIWLKKTTSMTTPEEALALGLSPGSLVHRFHRIRCADGVRVCLEFVVVPAQFLPSVDVVQESLYEAMAAAGSRPVRALQRLRAAPLSEAHSELLGVHTGECGLFIERRGFLSNGTAVEFSQCYYHGEAYDVIAELG